MMWDEIHTGSGRVVIYIQVRSLVNLYSIRDSRKTSEMFTLPVIFVVKGNKVVSRQVKDTIKVVGVWYRVEPFMNVGPDI
jgi:hypothetical protein